MEEGAYKKLVNPTDIVKAGQGFWFKTNVEKVVSSPVMYASPENAINPISQLVIVPNYPSDADVSVVGVDLSSNGVRDDVEVVIFGGLSYLNNVSRSDYEALLDIAKMIQPKDPVVPNSISERAIYCRYRALPSSIKEALPSEILYEAILNTQARKNAFYASLIAEQVSSGEEQCVQ